jgi:hypothetical protein
VVGTSPESIVFEAQWLLDDPKAHAIIARHQSLWRWLIAKHVLDALLTGRCEEFSPKFNHPTRINK